MGNINFNRLSEKFTAVPVFYPPKFQKWDDNRKEEGRTTKRKTIRERIWILSLAVSFSIQYADFVKIYALSKHSISFYLSTNFWFIHHFFVDSSAKYSRKLFWSSSFLQNKTFLVKVWIRFRVRRSVLAWCLHNSCFFGNSKS